MTTVRSYQDVFGLTDYTESIIQIPNSWGLINELGIFSNEGVAQNTLTVESTAGTLGLLVDKVRGERNAVNKDDTRVLRAFAIPHFPLDDAIKPEDIQGKRAFGGDQAETEAAVMLRKMERIRRNQAATWEFARAKMITSGEVYAPNGTVVENVYTSFGVTRKEVDYVLGTATTEVIAKSEEALAHIQDNILTGEVVDRVVVLCAPDFFAKLIAHPKVVEAYKYYTSAQEPLRNRLGTGIYRRFVFGSIEYVEYRGSFNGQALIPAGTAYMIPLGTTDTFKTYFGPANRFEYVNTIGLESYLFSFRNPSNTEITLQSETNFLNLIRRPQCVVKLVTSN